MLCDGAALLSARGSSWCSRKLGFRSNSEKSYDDKEPHNWADEFRELMLLHREVVDPVDEVKESEEDQEVSEDGLGCALVIPLRQNENSS